MHSRDRDASGRPRNARPRDAQGRPLPRGARGVQRVAGQAVHGPDDALRQAQQLIDAGSPFHAHEVLEEVWKAAAGPQRELWRGLAQLAVGLTHAQRGNPKGAVALLRRGADRIEPYSGDPPYRLDVGGLVRHARWLAARIDQEGIPAAEVLRLQLQR